MAADCRLNAEEKNNVKEDSKEQAISRQESEGRKNEHRLTDTHSKHALPRTRKPEKPISPKIGHPGGSVLFLARFHVLERVR